MLKNSENNTIKEIHQRWQLIASINFKNSTLGDQISRNLPNINDINNNKITSFNNEIINDLLILLYSQMTTANKTLMTIIKYISNNSPILKRASVPTNINNNNNNNITNNNIINNNNPRRNNSIVSTISNVTLPPNVLIKSDAHSRQRSQSVTNTVKYNKKSSLDDEIKKDTYNKYNKYTDHQKILKKIDMKRRYYQRKRKKRNNNSIRSHSVHQKITTLHDNDDSSETTDVTTQTETETSIDINNKDSEFDGTIKHKRRRSNVLTLNTKHEWTVDELNEEANDMRAQIMSLLSKNVK